MFIGKFGTTNYDAYKKAEQLFAEGVDAIQVRQLTGLSKGLDGELKEEISDKNSKILNANLDKVFCAQYEAGELDAVWYDTKPDGTYSVTVNRFEPNSAGSYFEYLGVFTKDDLMNTFNFDLVKAIIEDQGIDSKRGSLVRASGMKIVTPEPLKVSEVFQHDELYKRYPEIGNIPVFVAESSSTKASLSTNAEGEHKIKVSIDLKRDLVLARTALLHELQHAVQRKEGWAIGANQNMFSPVDRTLYDATKAQTKLNKLLEDSVLNSVFAEFLSLSRELTKKHPNAHKNSFDPDFDRLEVITNKLDALEPMVMRLYDEISDLVDYGSGVVSPYEQYQHAAGEIEAHLIMDRADMTDAELSTTIPYKDEDYENALVFRSSYDQFVVKDDYKSRNVSMGAARDGQFMELLFKNHSVGVDAMHASSFIFLRAYSKLAEEGVSEVIKNDYQAILDWDRDMNDGSGSMSYSLAKHFAKAFESYILFATAPKQIETQLGTFKHWIQSTALKLNPEIADKGAYDALYPLFDRMLASASASDLNPVMAEAMASQIMDSADSINHELAHSTGVVIEAFYQSLARNAGIPADEIRQRYGISIQGEKSVNSNDHQPIKRQIGFPVR